MHDKGLLAGMLCGWGALITIFIAIGCYQAFNVYAPWMMVILNLAWQLIIIVFLTGIAFYSLDLVKEKWQL